MHSAARSDLYWPRRDLIAIDRVRGIGDAFALYAY
jgi:hypothetical protein